MPGRIEVCEEVGKLFVGLKEIRASQLADRLNRPDALAASELGNGNMLGCAPVGQVIRVTVSHELPLNVDTHVVNSTAINVEPHEVTSAGMRRDGGPPHSYRPA
jgi:hypothetical protein